MKPKDGITPILQAMPVDDSNEEVFQNALAVAAEKLSRLNIQRGEYIARLIELDAEIAKLRSKVISVADLVGSPPSDSPISKLKEFVTEMGLTDAIRQVLMAHNHGLTPKEVRDWLVRMGVDLSGYGNVQASIHAILKRLQESGEADRAVDKKTGKHINLYMWSPFQAEGGGQNDTQYYRLVRGSKAKGTRVTNQVSVKQKVSRKNKV